MTEPLTPEEERRLREMLRGLPAGFEVPDGRKWVRVLLATLDAERTARREAERELAEARAVQSEIGWDVTREDDGPERVWDEPLSPADALRALHENAGEGWYRAGHAEARAEKAERERDEAVEQSNAEARKHLDEEGRLRRERDEARMERDAACVQVDRVSKALGCPETDPADVSAERLRARVADLEEALRAALRVARRALDTTGDDGGNRG